MSRIHSIACRLSRSLAPALIAVLSTLAASGVASAEQFHADARVFCPASLELDPSGNPVAIDASFADASIEWVPCAGVKVRVMDADDDWDDTCAEAYTDSQGRISVQADCFDGPLGGGPEIYLSIESKSAFGFSIGTWEYDFWDVLVDLVVLTNPWGWLASATGVIDLPNFVTSHETSEWVTREYPVRDNQRLDFRDVMMGDDFHAGPNTATQQEAPLWAARQYWIAHASMGEIRRGTVYRPMYFEWTVDHPLFGAPTTIWDLIIVDADRMQDATNRPRALQATPHEIGHVIHNKYHSGYNHWIASDALGYAKVHRQCTEDTLVLGWYEGFANFVEDYVYTASDSHVTPGVDWRPFDGCAVGGLAKEGNVQALLNRIYHGPLDAVYDLDNTPLRDEFSCLPGFTLGQHPVTFEWRCTRDRAVICRIGQETRVTDGANDGITDLCERPSQHQNNPFAGITQYGTNLNCLDGSLCPNLTLLGTLTPNVGGDAGGSDAGTTPTITVEPTHDEDGNPLPGSDLPTWDPTTDIPQREEPGDLTNAVQIFPADCGIYDDPTGTLTIRRVSGIDRCIEDAVADWDPPVDPAAPDIWRVDGSSRSVIAENDQGVREWWGLPGLDDMIGFVHSSGSGEHRFQEHWDDTIEGFCRGSDPYGRRWFCNPDASTVFLDEIRPLGTLQISP